VSKVRKNPKKSLSLMTMTPDKPWKQRQNGSIPLNTYALADPLNTDELTSTYLTNWEALEQLEKHDKLLTGAYCGFGSLLIGGAALGLPFSPITLGALAPMAFLLNRTQKFNRVARTTKALLDAFGDSVVITPRIDVPEARPIDLFVRFPGRVLLLISIRSKGKSRIIYNEQTETLCFRFKRPRAGLQKWQPDPLTELSEYQRWLMKNRRLLGLSSREVSKPLAKVLMLAGETSLDDHQEHLYSMMDGQRVLWIRKKGTAAVITEEQIVSFTKAYLAQESQKREKQPS